MRGAQGPVGHLGHREHDGAGVVAAGVNGGSPGGERTTGWSAR